MSAALNASLKQAIIAARGDKADAARRLVALAKHDPAVLLALTDPYLQGIAFDAVNKVMARAAAKSGVPDPSLTPAQTRMPSAPAHILAQSVPTTPPPTVKAPPKPEPETPPVQAVAVVAPPPKPAPKPAPPPVRRTLKPGEIPPETLDAIFDQIGKTLPPVKRSVRQPKTPEEAMMQGVGRDPNGPPPPVAGANHQKAILAMAKSFKKK
ncbi:MAG: hypothetical protein ACOVKO_03800 [Elstera sp.]